MKTAATNRIEPNPTVPTGLPIPRDFPRLTPGEHSQALKELFAERARVFTYIVTLLFVPLILLDQPLVSLVDGRGAFLLIGCGLLAFLIADRQQQGRNRRPANAAALAICTLVAISLFLLTPPATDSAMDRILLAAIAAGALFVTTPSFILVATICAALYGLLAIKTGAEALLSNWLELLTVAGISLIVHVAARSKLLSFNELALREEARLDFYNKAVQQAREEQERFKRLSDAGREALIVHSEGKILDANLSAVQLLGYETNELVGRPVTDLFASQFVRFTEQINDPDNTSLARIKVVRKDGSHLESMAFNNVLVFRNQSASVLGFRKVDSQVKTDTAHFFQDLSRN